MNRKSIGAFLLAAGEGKRLRPHTENMAKPALPFLNLPMLAYSYRLAQKVGIQDFVINHFHQGESLVEASLEVQKKLGGKIQFSRETELLGHGAFSFAKEQVKSFEHLWVANADTIFLVDKPQLGQQFIDYHLDQKSEITFWLAEHPEAGKSFPAAWVNGSGLICHFGLTCEDKNLRPLHVTGRYLLSTKLIEDLPSTPFNLIYDYLIQKIQSGLKVHSWNNGQGLWFETGNPSSYLKATDDCLKILEESGEGSSFLKTLFDEYHPNWRRHSSSNRLFSSSQIPGAAQGSRGLWGENIEFSEGLSFKGFSVIGSETHFSKNLTIEDSVFGSSLAIQTDSCNTLKF